jgi:hypothetical protein
MSVKIILFYALNISEVVFSSGIAVENISLSSSNSLVENIII